MAQGVGGGPKPKSVATHEREGTFRAARHGRRRPVKMPKAQFVTPPDYLTKLQKELWLDVVTSAPIDVLARCDLPTLAAYVTAYSRLIEANLAQQKHEVWCAKQTPLQDPLLFETKSGNVVQSPYIGMMNRATDKIRSLACEMGFTPVSRIRLSAAAGEGLDLPAASSSDDIVAGDAFDEVTSHRPN